MGHDPLRSAHESTNRCGRAVNLHPRWDRHAHGGAVPVDDLIHRAPEVDRQAGHRAVQPGREPPAGVPLHVLEHERRAFRVGRLADVGRDLELGAHFLRDVNELPGLLERLEVLRKADTAPPPLAASGDSLGYALRVRIVTYEREKPG